MVKSLNSVDAYPLQWPMGWPRTETPTRARFGTRDARGWGVNKRSVANARDILLEEMRRIGVDSTYSVVISTNMPTRKDGLPYSNAKEPDDSGVAVYFTIDGDIKVIPRDLYDRVADNIYAIALVIQAMRLIERHGGETMLKAAMVGMRALPESGSGAKWWEVLGMQPGDPPEEIKRSYRHLSALHHPDGKEPNEGKFHAVQEAWRQARQVLGV